MAAQRHKEVWHAINAILGTSYAPPAIQGTPGVITAINGELAVETNFIQPLTTFATGFKDSADLTKENDFFGPRVKVSEFFQYAQADSKEAFLSDAGEDLRAARADFKAIEVTETKVTARTEERGLQMIVDAKEFNLKGGEFYTAKILARLNRNSLRRKLALLLAASVNVDVNYNGTAGLDPDADVITDLIAGANARGMKSNRVGYGDSIWAQRFLNLSSQTAPALAARAGFTPDQLAQLLVVDQVLVSQSRYSSSASAKAEVVGKNLLSFFALDNADENDASNIKHFWSPQDMGGGQFAVYQWNIGAKMVGIAVSHNELTTITSTLGIRRRTQA